MKIVIFMEKGSCKILNKNCYSKDNGIYESIDEALESSNQVFYRYCYSSLEERSEVVRTIKEVGALNKEYWAALALEETGMGNLEDKISKHEIALRTRGTEDLADLEDTGDFGTRTIKKAPIGVISVMIPITNVTETIINNCIQMLAAGNTVIISPNKIVEKISFEVIVKINRAIKENPNITSVRGDDNLITGLANINRKRRSELLENNKIGLTCVTGSKGMVDNALKKASNVIGAGEGNPPVFIDETADIEYAAECIIKSAAFDNNLLCTSEKEIIVHRNVYNSFLHKMEKKGAYKIEGEELRKLQEMILDVDVSSSEEKVSTKLRFVGKSANYLLDKLGIKREKDYKLIFAETSTSHYFAKTELLTSVLPIIKAEDVDEAIGIAVELEKGNKHTASIFSESQANIEKFEKEIDTMIFTINAPTYSAMGVGLGLKKRNFPKVSFTLANKTGEGFVSTLDFTKEKIITSIRN